MASKKNEELEKSVDIVSALLPSRSTKEEMLARVNHVSDDYKAYLEGMDPKVKQRMITHVNSMKTGLQSIAPMTCLGPEKCIFVEQCPIPSRSSEGEMEFGPISNYPVAQPCILEKFYMQQKVMEYYEHLKVDPYNPVEVSIVNELALIDLYKNRSVMLLATGDKAGQGRDFMRVDVVGFNENGQVAEAVKLHPAVEMMDRLEKRREKWLDRLMETRKSKADWMAKVGNSTDKDSAVLEELRKLKTALESKVVDADIDEDDDILLS